MKVGSILTLFEKYGIIQKGTEDTGEDGFRGRGVTILRPKGTVASCGIDWERQDLLERESYHKLEQIKRLLFYPSCRKRFILEYFGDETDLQTLGDSCGACDYCIERSKLARGEVAYLVNLSVFEIVLDVVKRLNAKFGAKTMAAFLHGKCSPKMAEWGMEDDDACGVLAEYSVELVEGLIDALIRQGYLERTEGNYPLLQLTTRGRTATRAGHSLKEAEEALQSYLLMTVKHATPPTKSAKKSKRDPSERPKKSAGVSTYAETLALYHAGRTLREIAEERGVTLLTIENHILRLYEEGDIPLSDIMDIVDMEHVHIVKRTIETEFSGEVDKLKSIREALESGGQGTFSYFEIRACIALMAKRAI